jgi:hypothetical protein
MWHVGLLVCVLGCGTSEFGGLEGPLEQAKGPAHKHTNTMHQGEGRVCI